MINLMNKKYLITVIVLFILIVGLFLYLNTEKVGADTNRSANNIHIFKGWNVLASFYNPESSQESSQRTSFSGLSSDDIKVIYTLNPKTKEYIRIWPDIEMDKVGDLDDDDLISQSFWVYSDKEGYVNYYAQDFAPYAKRKMWSGWNMIGITPDMFEDVNTLKSGKKYFDIMDKFEKCEVEKIYFFEPVSQSWQKLTSGAGLDSDSSFYGFFTKVSNSCFLGKKSFNSAPPALPN